MRVRSQTILKAKNYHNHLVSNIKVAMMATGEAMRQSKVKLQRPAGNFSGVDGEDVDLRRFYLSDPLQRIELIRQGIPAARVGQLAALMGVSKKALVGCLQLSPSSINRNEREGKLLSSGDSERVLGVEKIIGLVLEMVEQSGNLGGFDCPRWIGNWLSNPIPALAGAPPLSYMDTIEGQRLVLELLSMGQSGAFA